MGRKTELRLKVEEPKSAAPSFFRCPISMEVMRSPVSLCTGVTYDRSSIQRWLDSGNLTCPATNLALPSTDLVPNLTLRRLIALYRSSSPQSYVFAPEDPLASLLRLADHLSDPATADSDKNGLVSAADFAGAILEILNHAAAPDLKEAAARVLSLILTVDCIDESSRELVIAAIAADPDRSAASLISILRAGASIESRTNAATVLDAILPSCCGGPKIEVVPELIRLIGPSVTDLAAIDAGLRCLIGLATASRRMRAETVRAGVVPALAHVLAREGVPAGTAGRAMRVLELAVGSAEGRAVAGEMAEEIAENVVRMMMKVGKEGREAAVAVLWGVCCCGGGDRRARKAVAGISGLMAKILMVMQGDCSPAARRMAGDLLRVLRVDSKSDLAGYDTRTIHIMPF